jgi:hypothetical protein
MKIKIRNLNYVSCIFVAFQLFFVTFILFCPLVHAITFYVSTNGNDQWSGKFARPNESGTDGPLASITGARDSIRKFKQDNPFNEPVDVIVSDGVYRLSQPIIFESRDSGTEQYRITYRAFPGSHPVFSGGRVISGFKPYNDGLWRCILSKLANFDEGFDQLFANGTRLTRAMSPNASYYYMRSSESPQTQKNAVEKQQNNFDTIYALPDDMAQLLKLREKKLQDILVTVYHSWEVSKHRILRINAPSNTIILNGRTRFPIQLLGTEQRYVLENYNAALDSPSEWFLDRKRILYYYPRSCDDIQKFVAEAPAGLEHLVILKGEPENNKFISYINFKGLTFSYSDNRLSEKGNSDMQAAVSITAAIIADGCKNVKFEDCEISHTGNYGVWFRRGCSSCSVVRSYMHDLGAGGVKIGEPGIRKDENEFTDKITVENCIIREGGRIYPGAVAVWIGQSGKNRVAYNDISDFFYTGISVGWRWGYGATLAHNNIIEYNHIHRLGQKVLSDLGGIYTLGESPGTLIRNNIIHDIFSYDLYGKGAWGIYNDQGSSFITTENNLVYNTQTGGYHLNGGKENTIRNNIFAFGRDFQLQNSGAEPTLSFTFSNNIIIWDRGQLCYGKWKEANLRLSENIYWDISRKPIKFNEYSFQAWQRRGRDTGSLIMDPNFIDASQFDFRLDKLSPAIRSGFVPFDFSIAGVYGDYAWRKLAAQPIPCHH